MAINKIVVNNGDGTTETLIDLTSDTVTEDTLADGVVAHDASGEEIVGRITKRSSTDLTVDGKTVSVPSGYYSSQATKSVATGSAGTPSASKGTVTNHQVTITPSVTNVTGYITGGTKTGTGVTVSASELVSGSQTITENKTVNVTNLAEIVVNIPYTTIYKLTSVPSDSEGNEGDICVVKV